MLIKLLKKIAFGFVGLILLVVLIAGIGSYLSLDANFSHSKQTANLPLFSQASTFTDEEVLRIQANGFEFRARVAGNVSDRPTVILLHGFPVTSAMWKPLISALASSGYRVVAFDQRGYSPGARPFDVALYSLPNLVSDVLAVADAVGSKTFHLVGHDWGSAVGWATMLEHPDRVLSWTGLSIAHPQAFSDALLNDPDQQARSSYFTLFRTPIVPEVLLTFNALALLRQAYEGMSNENVAEYLAVLSEPQALSSALNWYRQMGNLTETISAAPETSVPTLFVWGSNDSAVGRAAVLDQRQYMKGPYKVIETDGEHWLMSSHADQIIAQVLEHIGGID
ncbi:MAG: pimeloyl-ACP methyl ester carboxylesterase [Pseudohongiellaceae bacterium]|jgi:pimeloyl-ACP methyl ester carboxylesterase